jgi:hypothetical protein
LQEFSEFLNYAQDKLVVRVEPDEERGLVVYLGAEFYPPALPEQPAEEIHEEEEKQPIVAGQPSLLEPNPPPAPEPKPPKRPRRTSPRGGSGGAGGDRPRRPRKKKTE